MNEETSKLLRELEATAEGRGFDVDSFKVSFIGARAVVTFRTSKKVEK